MVMRKQTLRFGFNTSELELGRNFGQRKVQSGDKRFGFNMMKQGAPPDKIWF